MALKSSEQPIEITFAITETGANTFTQVEVDLPVQLGQGMVFDLDLIEVDGGMTTLDAAAAGRVAVDLQVTLNTQAALLAYTNDDLVAAINFVGHASAADTVGYGAWGSMHKDTRDRANYIASDSVFIAIQGANQGGARTVRGRLVGSLVKVKMDELTQLVLSQL